jgi:phage terminase large subunit GpA-like protein
MRRTQGIPISASKQAQQLAKLNLSSLSTKPVISFLIEIFRCFDALSTPFYTLQAVHAEFIIETSPATLKTQSFVDFDENWYFRS